MANEPTAEEAAETAARAKRNRLDAIMRGESETAPPHPADIPFRRMGDGGGQAEPPDIVRKVNVDALKPVDDAAREPGNAVQDWLAGSKAKRGEADATRLEKWAARCVELSAGFKSSPRKAIEDICMELGGLDISIARQHDQLRREIKVLRSDLEQARASAEAVARQADTAAGSVSV